MSKERQKKIGTKQIKMREINVSIDGTAGTPSASGPDQFGISQVIDLGAGNYTIILRDPSANGKSVSVGGHSMLTASTAMSISAVAFDRVTVQCTDLAGGALDADFSICIKVHDARFEI